MALFGTLSKSIAAVALVVALPLPALAGDLSILTTKTENVATANIVAVLENWDTDSSERHTISDMAIEFGVMQDIQADPFLEPNQPGRSEADWAFVIRLITVANGQLFPEGYAMCSRWDQDVSVCGVECDGGTFVVKRRNEEGFIHLTTIFGSRISSDGYTSSGQVRIGDCGEGSRHAFIDPGEGNSVEITFSRWR